MANKRPHITLDELSKKVAEDIGYNIVNLFDREEMARGVLDALGHEEDEEVGETFGDYLEAKAAEGAIGEVVGDTCDDEEILKTVTKTLKEAGFTNDPPAAESSNVGDINIAETVAAAVRAATADLRPQPSMLSMDVTALREQILTNCKTINALYNIPAPPSIPQDIIMTSDGDTNFRASVGRTLPGTGIMITIESAACASTTQALEHLYRVSCLVLTRCRASAKKRGGGFMDWKTVVPPQR